MSITSRCEICNETFSIQDEDLEFYERIGVPPPRLCPEDRQRRRAAFRNERNFYNRNCDGTGDRIISMYSPESPFPIYERDHWWGDSWSPLEYGLPISFDRPFFEQFRELQLLVPRASLFSYKNDNSYYTNHSVGNKNCYMAVDVGGCEDVFFSNWVLYCKDCVDCTHSHHCELCYQLLHCKRCFNCDFCENCHQCTDCSYCFDCQNCNNCFGCAGLRNKQYHIFNQSVSKDRYEEFMLRRRGSYAMQCQDVAKFPEVRLSVPHRYAYIIQCENCEGDYLFQSKNAFDAYDGVNLWDCKYMFESSDTKDSYDCYQPGFEDCELIYEAHAGNTLFSSNFIHLCHDVADCEYCDQCFHSKNLFGCVSLRNKQYCILNRQYSEQEYLHLVTKLKQHMVQTGEYGEFFPFWCSPFSYNESKAQELYPLEQEQAEAIGASWRVEGGSKTPGRSSILPDNIQDIDDSITKQVIICEKSGRPFKVTSHELRFYQKKKLPLPRKHFNVRYQERMALRNPRKLWDRDCSNCESEVRSTYAPERPEDILCEPCYLEDRF